MQENGSAEGKQGHPVGYVDAMAAAERARRPVTELPAGRKAALGAALGERSPATDGTITWASATGRTRTTEPQHRLG